VAKNVNPIFNQKFEWYNVAVSDSLELEFFDHDALGDEYLGTVEFEISAELHKLPKDQLEALWDVTLPLAEVPADKGTNNVAPSTVTLSIEFVPFEYDF